METTEKCFNVQTLENVCRTARAVNVYSVIECATGTATATTTKTTTVATVCCTELPKTKKKELSFSFRWTNSTEFETQRPRSIIALVYTVEKNRREKHFRNIHFRSTAHEVDKKQRAALFRYVGISNETCTEL